MTLGEKEISSVVVRLLQIILRILKKLTIITNVKEKQALDQ